MTRVTVNAHEYSDDGSAARDMLNGGAKVWLLPLAADMVAVAGGVSNSAAAAATSAALAVAMSSALSGASATSVTISGGVKSFTTQTNKQFNVGNFVIIPRLADPTVYMYGQITAYNATTGALSVNVLAVSGAGTFADWVICISGVAGTAGVTGPAGAGNVRRSARTANAILTAADTGTLIDVTSGTFTQTFTAAVTLGNGWSCYYRNSGTGVVTLDPNGGELIDGVTNGTVKGTYLITCDGVGFSTARVGPMANQVLLTSGTSWTAPMGAKTVRKRVQGAGGGSSGTPGAGSQTAPRGAGGGTAESIIELVPGTAYPYTIGAGGTGGAAGVGIGGVGGASSFTANGVTYTGNGGDGGKHNSGSGNAPSGGTAVNGTLNITGSPDGSTDTGYGTGGTAVYTYNMPGTAGMNGAIILEW